MSWCLVKSLLKLKKNLFLYITYLYFFFSIGSLWAVLANWWMNSKLKAPRGWQDYSVTIQWAIISIRKGASRQPIQVSLISSLVGICTNCRNGIVLSLGIAPTSPTSLVSASTPPTKIGTLSAPASSDEADDDEFVQFEEDDKVPGANNHDQPAAVITITPATVTPPPPPPPTTEPLTTDSTNVQNMNLSAFQQLTASIPGFNNLTPTLDLARSFASYMQAVAKATSSPGSATSQSATTSPSPAFDLKSALARFPALDALLKKESTSTVAAPHPNTTQSMPTSPTSSSPAHSSKIYPTTPTNPPMYITVIDNVTVCVATLSVPQENGDKTYTVLRRLDTGFVNGTSLLTAGGIDTERERSMILSFEMERIRIPNKGSDLCGTWIPLRRAQELAVTCSIQNRLGPFLSDRVESYFSSTIPITRGPSGVRSGKPLARIRRTPSGTDLAGKASLQMMSAAANEATSAQQKQQPSSSTQLQQLLLSHPYKTLKLGGGDSSTSPLGMLKAPLLGSFDRTADLRHRRSISIITSQRSHSKLENTSSNSSNSGGGDGDGDKNDDTSTPPTATTSRDLDIDILNDDSVDDSDADTESDTDVNEVRQRMKRMRDAAIDAMETGHSMEELLSRASGPILHPLRPPMKRRRLFNIDEETPFRKPANFLPHGRRRPPAAVAHLGGGKLTASMIKKSASWNGSLPRNSMVVPGTKKSAMNAGAKRKKQRKDESVNHVVEHNQVVEKELPPVPEIAVVVTKPDQDEEDEEIDIGGSDDDDDVR